jgi:signal transduction histidine kinase
MAIVLALHRDALVRPALAWLLVGVALAWTIAATLLMQSNPEALERAPAILGELAIGAALGIGGGIVYTHTTDPSTAFSSVRTLGFAWPIAGIISAGVVFGGGRGALAGLAVAIPRFFSPVVNGVTFGQYRGGAWFSLCSTLLLYTLAGGVAGYMAALLRRAQDEVAAARAREQVARTLHDGVLQTLAVIERRSDDPQLARLAREQERDLREFLFSGNGHAGEGADLGARLRAAAGRFENAFPGRVDVVVAPDMPRLDAGSVEALAAAVGEALTNAGKHGEAKRVTVFAEPSDDGDGVMCSVHDDGRGFDLVAVREGVGLSRSIRGRMLDIGGRAEIESSPGAGTEVRLWLPCG